VGDTVVSLLFGNKGLPLFKMVAELAGKSRYKMADLDQNGRPIAMRQRACFPAASELVGRLQYPVADLFLYNTIQ